MKALLTFFAFLIGFNTFGQTIQTFAKDNFMVGCNCKLYPDEVHMKMVREQGSPYPNSAYVCAANKDSYATATINNITIQDMESEYKGVSSPTGTAYFEKLFLQKYFNGLKANGISVEYITYRGVRAIHYHYKMMETMPAEAYFFVKNKKGYLLQAASRSKLDSKFQMMIGTFSFIK